MTERREDLVDIFKDERGEWRWRVIAPNGEFIATSGEGYINRTHAREMARRLFPALEIHDNED